MKRLCFPNKGSAKQGLSGNAESDFPTAPVPLPPNLLYNTYRSLPLPGQYQNRFEKACNFRILNPFSLFCYLPFIIQIPGQVHRQECRAAKHPDKGRRIEPGGAETAVRKSTGNGRRQLSRNLYYKLPPRRCLPGRVIRARFFNSPSLTPFGAGNRGSSCLRRNVLQAAPAKGQN